MDKNKNAHSVVLNISHELLDGNEFWDTVGVVRPDEIISHGNISQCVWYNLDWWDRKDVSYALSGY